MKVYTQKDVEYLKRQTEQMMINLYTDSKFFLVEYIHNVVKEHLSRMDRYFTSEFEIVDLVENVKNEIMSKSFFKYSKEDYKFLPIFFKFMQEDGTAFPNIARMASLGIQKSLIQVIHDEFPEFNFVDVTPEPCKRNVIHLRIELEKNVKRRKTSDNVFRYGTEILYNTTPISPPY